MQKLLLSSDCSSSFGTCINNAMAVYGSAKKLLFQIIQIFLPISLAYYNV